MDVIGNYITREFLKFSKIPFKINSIYTGQSFISLFSEPIITHMEEIKTDDLAKLSKIFKDYNKTIISEVAESSSNSILIDLTCELSNVYKINDTLIQKESLEYHSTFNHKLANKLTPKEIFELYHQKLNSISKFLRHYNKVIIIVPLNKHDQVSSDSLDELSLLKLNEEFSLINLITRLLQDKVENIHILTIDDYYTLNENLEIEYPIEVYNELLKDIQRLVGKTYNSEILFDEYELNNVIHIRFNYLDYREHIVHIYFNGEVIKEFQPSASKEFQYAMKEAGTYRIRVFDNITDLPPRFSRKYNYRSNATNNNLFKGYVIPTFIKGYDSDILNLLDRDERVLGYISNSFENNLYNVSKSIISPNEVTDSNILTANQILQIITEQIKDKRL